MSKRQYAQRLVTPNLNGSDFLFVLSPTSYNSTAMALNKKKSFNQYHYIIQVYKSIVFQPKAICFSKMLNQCILRKNVKMQYLPYLKILGNLSVIYKRYSKETDNTQKVFSQK